MQIAIKIFSKWSYSRMKLGVEKHSEKLLEIKTTFLYSRPQVDVHFNEIGNIRSRVFERKVKMVLEMGDFKKVRLFCGLLQFNSIFLPTVLSSGQDIYLENTFLKSTDFHRILKTISAFSPLTFEFSRNTQKVRQAENKRNNSMSCHLSFPLFVHEVSLLSPLRFNANIKA